ncbi:RHS repeat-associated core domain-containing protein [Asticcacaulis benevestitus]|nr:RHS repeat-associated core domain-containing protein [Asticcacaulis benevestitus]
MILLAILGVALVATFPNVSHAQEEPYTEYNFVMYNPEGTNGDDWVYAQILKPANAPAGTLGWCAVTTLEGTAQVDETIKLECHTAIVCNAEYEPWLKGIVPTGAWYRKRCTFNGFADETQEFHCDEWGESGWIARAPGYCVTSNDKECDCDANNGSMPVATTPHPINTLTGSKRFSARDFASSDGTLLLDRHYNSRPNGGVYLIGSTFTSLRNWTIGYDIQMVIDYHSSPTDAAFKIVYPGGSAQTFKRQSDGSLKPEEQYGSATNLTDATLTLTGSWPTADYAFWTSSSTFTLRDRDDNLWTLASYQPAGSGGYNAAHPVSVQRPDGTTLTFAYSNNALQSVTDQAGKAMTFTWNTATQGATTVPQSVKDVTLPGGYKIKYTYASGDYSPLTKVEYLNASATVIDSTTYQYGNASFPNAITAILDHTNAVRWKVTYDSQGRATRSEGPNGEFAAVVDYTSSGGAADTRKVTNAFGRETTYTYDTTSGFKLTGASSTATTNVTASNSPKGFNASTQLDQETDEEGRVTKYTRDAAGHPTQIIEAFGTPQARTTNITWHTSFSQPTQIAAPGLTTNYTYNGVGQVLTLSQIDTTSQTVPYSTNGQTRTWTFTYGTTGGATGKLVSIDGPLSGTGDTVAYTYNTNGYLASVTDEVGKATTITAWDWRGGPLTVVDPNSVSTTFTYDIHGRVLTSTVNPGASQSQYAYTYDVVGNMTKMTLPTGGYLEYTYDAASRLTKIKNEKNETIDLTPDAEGQPTLQVVKNASATITAQQSMVYDEMGRLLRTVGGASTTSTRLGYDKVSNLTQTTDGRDKVWQTGFDALNRVIEETNPEAEKVKYGYAANNTLTSHKDGRDLETTRITNGFGEVIREVSPDKGTTTYWYDAAGRLTKTQDADTVETNYAYDNAGRLTSRTFTGASWETQTFTYDATASGNKGNGRLTGVTEQSGSTAYTYDAQGRVTTDAKTINGLSYSVQYAYDINGDVTQMTLPSGRVVTLTRDNSGLVTAITTKPTSSGTVSNVATSVAYQPFSSLKSLTYGNGLTLTDTYNLNNWLTRIQVKDGSTAKFDLSYDYYDDGRLGEIVDNAATGRTVYMSLSDSGRLSWAGGPFGQNAYDYDGAGNRIGSYLTVGGVTTSNNEITAGDSNRLTQVQNENGVVKRALTYRDGGDLYTDAITGGDTYSYHYSSRQRLVVVKKNTVDAANYGYDYREQRVWRRLISGSTSTEIHYIFDEEGHLIAEHNGYTGAVLREYVWLDDKPLAVIDSTGSTKVTYYIHSGHLNEPQMMTNAAKTKVWDAYVTPFGQAQVFATASANIDIRLPGQWYQAEAAGAGLNQNHYRDYDPSLGRYIQTDPLGIDAGQNPYAYVDGKPYDLVDPQGLKIRVSGEYRDYARVQQALKYLKKDPGMKKIIDRLDADQRNHWIKTNNMHDNSSQGGNVNWDPNSYLQICGGPDNGKLQTPDLGLGHELAHLVDPLWYGKLPHFQYDNFEEERVITGPETAAARTLGEPVRYNHGGNIVKYSY